MTYERAPGSRRWILAAALSLPATVGVYAGLLAVHMPPAPRSDEPMRLSQVLSGDPIIVGVILTALAAWVGVLIAREAFAVIELSDEAITVSMGFRHQTLRWDELTWVDLKLRTMQYILTGGKGVRLEVNLGWVPADRRQELVDSLQRQTAAAWDRQRQDIREYGIRQGRDAQHLVLLRFAGMVTVTAVAMMVLNELGPEGRLINLLPAIAALAGGWGVLCLLVGTYAAWPLEFTATHLTERRPLKPRVFELSRLTHIVLERDWLPHGSFERVHLIAPDGRLSLSSSMVWYPLLLEHVLRCAPQAEVLVLGDRDRSPLEAAVLPPMPAPAT